VREDHVTRTRLFRPLAAVAAGLGVVALAIAGCGDDSGGSKSFDLKLGQVVPLTGDLSVFGPPGEKAGNLAVDQALEAVQAQNADIGISVEAEDEETKPQPSVQAARKLVSGGSGCLAGAWASADTIPVAKSVAIRERVPLISPASTSAEITDLSDNGLVFRTAPSDNLQAEALAQVISQRLKGAQGKTLSIAGRNDAYGDGFTAKLKEAWDKLGGTSKGPLLYDPEQPNYNSEAGQIVEGNPDAYVIIDFPETYAKVGAALTRTGDFDAKKLFVADGLASDTIPEGVPPAALEGASGTRPGTPEAGAAAKAFNTLYTTSPGVKARQTFDAQNFDAVMLCFLAAVKAGSEKGSDIAEEITAVSGPGGTKYTFEQLGDAVKALQDGQDIDYEGASGPIDLDEQGDPSTATYEEYSYKNGKLEVNRSFQAEYKE
jgi:branched-chain amino acid transport system substrate-binding protein